LVAVVFDGSGFSVTFKPQQLFLMSSIIRNVISNSFEDNTVREFKKRKTSETKKKGQDCREIR